MSRPHRGVSRWARRWARGARAFAAAVPWGLAVAGCAADGGAGAPQAVGEEAAAAALLASPALQRLVEAGLDRRVPPLVEALDDADPAARATAALSLGSVQDPATAPALAAHLDDPDPRVRREVAFALGQLGDAGRPDRLVASLAGETDPAARVALMEAAGKAGDAGTLRDVVAGVGEAPGGDAEGLALALYHFGRRGVTDPAAGPALLALLGAGDPRVAEVAARALARFPEGSGRGEALAAALDDPSVHVAEAAAGSLVRLEGGAGGAADRWAAWIEAHPGRPTVAAALLPGLVDPAHRAIVLGWAAGEDGADPALAYPALARVDTPRADSLLVAGLRGGRRQGYVAAAALADRLTARPDPGLSRSLVPVVGEALPRWGPHAPMSDLRGLLRLVEILVETHPEASGGLLGAAAGHPHAEVRALARRLGAPGTDDPPPERQAVDWDLLRQAGPRPRVEVVTAGGAFVVELHPEAAPLSVASFLDWAATGAYSDLTFHRVEPDFILQSGDVASPGGWGGPSLGLRSELSRLRYAPGVVGMASAGKDTEGSQYFVTHGHAPSLDGRYGAVGRIVSGLAVADAVARGDTVLAVRPVDAALADDPGRR